MDKEKNAIGTSEEHPYKNINFIRRNKGRDSLDIYYPKRPDVSGIDLLRRDTRPYSPGSAHVVAFLENLQQIWMRLRRERDSRRLTVKSTNPNLRFNAIAHEIPPELRPTSKRGRCEERIECLPCSNNSDSPGRGHFQTGYWPRVHSYRTIEHLPRFVNRSGSATELRKKHYR